MNNELSLEAVTMLRESATKACSLLKVLANEDRLLLLCQLIEGECNVGELEAMCAEKESTFITALPTMK